MPKGDAFETSLKALEKAVEKLDNGGIALEEALRLFEEGRRHAKICASKLSQVERKIQVLLENEKGEPLLQDFEAEATEPDDQADEAEGGSDDFPA